ncbi:hypothetical protein VTO42DRAFT_2764 [Malbranchea cinnamomea]
MPPRRRSRTPSSPAPAGPANPRAPKEPMPRIQEVTEDKESDTSAGAEQSVLSENRRDESPVPASESARGELPVRPRGRDRRDKNPAGIDDHPDSPDSSDNLPPAELKKYLERKLRALREENEILDLHAAIRNEKRKAHGNIERQLLDTNPQLSDQKLNEWLHSFDDHFEYMGSGKGIDDEEKILYAVMHFEKTAHKTWHGDKQARRSMSVTWEAFETWCRDLCEYPSTRGANTAERWNNARQGDTQDVLSFISHLQAFEADLFTEEEFSEAARVRVAKAKLSSDIRWELNRSGKVIKTYAALRFEALRLENILRDQKKLEAPRDKGLNRKLSDCSLKKRGLSTSQGDGALQKDNSGVQKDSKRSKGEGRKLPYDEYHTRREKDLCYMSKDSKDDSSKDAPKSGYKAHMARASSLPPVRPWESKTRMFEIDIVVVTASGIEHSLWAMIDSSVDVSFISHELVRQLLDWNLPKEPINTIECLNGSESPLYRTHFMSMVTVDSEGKSKRYDHSLASIHMVDVDIVLGMEWLEQVNPHIDWVEKTWRYRFEPENIDVVSVGRFLRAVRAGGEAYLATPQLLSPPAESLPDWLEDFQDVFSAEKAAELPPIDGPTHAIELKEGVEPPYMPIYNLSQKELETLRKYLEDSIGKGWIRESKSPAGAPVLFAPKADGSL